MASAYELKSLKKSYDESQFDEYLFSSNPYQEFSEFEINDVIYRQWKQEYFVDKIVVINKSITLHFRTITEGTSWIYGPNSVYCWCIRNTDDVLNYSNVVKVGNVKINGKLVLESLNQETIYCCGKSEADFSETNNHGYNKTSQGDLVDVNGNKIPILLIPVPDKYVMECELSFNMDILPLNRIDLIEGLNLASWKHHWHCFDLNLKVNRELFRKEIK